MNLYFFVLVSFGVILLMEKLEEIIARRFFRGYLEDVARKEEEIAEYHELSMLAMLSGDKEAYRGFQEMMSEVYAKVFFRRMAFFTSLYFLLLTPYMVLASYLYPNGFYHVLFIAITYFTIRLGYGYLREMVETYRTVKEFEKNRNC